jgi:hypothetical protein
LAAGGAVLGLSKYGLPAAEINNVAAMDNTEWFHRAGWGVFVHFLGHMETADEWNARVDAFDVEGLAGQLKSVGARYFFLTIGQNSGHYCSPNATYDSIVGIRPSKCSRRDLVADLAGVLDKAGIRLMVYLPAGAPEFDPVAAAKLHWETVQYGKPLGKRLAEFQRMWEAVIREWSARWAGKVHGWWIDGCYWPKDMYLFDDPPNFASFAAAMKAGNPHAVVAFNPGVKVPVVSMTDQEDYTAGELAEALYIPEWPLEDTSPAGPHKIKTATFHVLTYMGATWGQGSPRFPDEMVTGYTACICGHGGVITWEVPWGNGAIAPEFIRQLRLLKDH